MADVRPFRGLRFDPARAPLSRVLCPPYDVIGPEEAARLRRGADNAIHLELPEGAKADKYRNAARTWKLWRRSRLLSRDETPSLYIVEEVFKVGGHTKRRLGFLGALGVTPAAAKSVLAHERTLPKPKADRLRLLKAVRANVSPIFGLFPDPAGTARRIIKKTTAGNPAARGTMASGVRYRLWRLSDPRALAVIRRSLSSKNILIADGHHRYEVSRLYYARARVPAAANTLAYLCPEEDSGLVVLPTHRVLSDAKALGGAELLCRISRCRSRQETLRRLERSCDPYAFGFYHKGYGLAEPVSRAGCASGLGVEWLGKVLLKDVAPDRIRYTPDAGKAEALARSLKGAAIFVKPFPVAQIRRAVRAIGLLPPKSTYFFPKIATGLVFKALENGGRP